MIQIFFNYLFETFTLRTKPKYTPQYDEDEVVYLPESMTMER